MRTINGFLRYAAIGTLVLTISITSCKRKTTNDAQPDPDLTSERDISNSDNDNNSLLTDIDKALDNSSANLRDESSSYFTVIDKDSSKLPSPYTRYTQITYTGTADDGQSRNGVITILSVGKRTDHNFQASVTFSGTKVGGRSITGTKTITQQASGDANNKWQFAIVASGTVTTIDGKTITYTSNRTRIRTGISTSGNITDDSFTISGTWNGTNAAGESVSATISSPLQLSYNCHYFREITAGKIDFANNTKSTTRSIDYGTGACDGQGTFINANGKAFVFYFKR